MSNVRKGKIKFDPNLKVKIYREGSDGPVMESYGGPKYTPSFDKRHDFYMVDNKVMKCTMKLIGFTHSASSHKLVLEDDQGIKYYMRFTDFTKMVMTIDIIDGTVTDEFIFVSQANTPYIAPVLGRTIVEVQ